MKKRTKRNNWLLMPVVFLAAILFCQVFVAKSETKGPTTNIWPGDLLAFTPTEDGIRMQIPVADIDVVVDEAKAALDDIFAPQEEAALLIQVLKDEKSQLEVEIKLLESSIKAQVSLSLYKDNCYKAAKMIDSKPHTGISASGQVTHGW